MPFPRPGSTSAAGAPAFPPRSTLAPGGADGAPS